MILTAIVAAVGLAGGFLAGLLGIGGGIITAPLLLYVPPLLGQEPLGMHVVSGLTITQSLFAGLFGALAHRRHGNVDRGLATVMSIVVFVSALSGAAVSKFFAHEVLLRHGSNEQARPWRGLGPRSNGRDNSPAAPIFRRALRPYRLAV